jgi:hypothetical protein
LFFIARSAHCSIDQNSTKEGGDDIMGMKEACFSKCSLSTMRRMLMSCPIFDGVPKFVKFIGGSSKPLAVDAERGISLDGVVELGVEVVYASVNVVSKKLAKSSPMGGGGRCVAEDEIQGLGRNLTIDRLDDGEIVLNSSRIIRARNESAMT